MVQKLPKVKQIDLYFDRRMISEEMELLFRHIIALPDYDPANIDDAVDFMDRVSDDDLSEVCKTPPGLPVIVPGCASLYYSCELRNCLFEQLADIDLSLPQDDEGWLHLLLDSDLIASE